MHKYSSSRNKINVVFVRSDNHQYVSDWLRLDSTRLAPHGMFTSRAEKKKTPPKAKQTRTVSMIEERANPQDQPRGDVDNVKAKIEGKSSQD